MPKTSGHDGTAYTAKQVQLNALQSLRQHAGQPNIASLIEQAQDFSIHVEIFERGRQWKESAASQILWIQGPSNAPTPSRCTLMGACMVANVQRAKMATISVFCEPSKDHLVEVVCTLIKQLVQILPDTFYSRLDFSCTRFDLPCKTKSSGEQAISLLKDLLTVAPKTLLIVIDGLQLLDTAANHSNLKTLIGVLHQACNRAEAGNARVVKVLFTTDGFTDTLAALTEDDKINVMDFPFEEGSAVNANMVETGFL